MKITITLQDYDNGEVKVEEVRHLSPGEHEVTAASVLAEEMLALLSAYGEAETVLEASKSPPPLRLRHMVKTIESAFSSRFAIVEVEHTPKAFSAINPIND